MIDNVFDALADDRRRQLLFELLDDDPQCVSRLSGVSWEVGESDEGLLRSHLSSSREIPESNEELLREHHVHLPKLADYGFIEWNRNTGVVTRGPRFDEVRPLLELLDGRRDDLPAAWIRRHDPAAPTVERSSR